MGEKSETAENWIMRDSVFVWRKFRRKVGEFISTFGPNTLALTKHTLTPSTPQFAALRIPFNGNASRPNGFMQIIALDCRPTQFLTRWRGESLAKQHACDDRAKTNIMKTLRPLHFFDSQKFMIFLLLVTAASPSRSYFSELVHKFRFYDCFFSLTSSIYINSLFITQKAI